MTLLMIERGRHLKVMRSDEQRNRTKGERALENDVLGSSQGRG